MLAGPGGAGAVVVSDRGGGRCNSGGETYGSSDVVPDTISPPPGFPPFSWLIVSECVAVERLVSSLASCPVCARLWPSPGSLTCGSLFRRRERHLAMSVPADCFPGGAHRRNRPGSLRVSFADDVSMLAVGSPTVCSPVLEEPVPLVSPIVVEDVVIPEGETYGSSDVVPDTISPPPGFPPFSWLIVSECVAVERFGSSLGDDALPDVLVSNPDGEPSTSAIAQDQVSASADSPDDVLLISPLVDVGTDSVPDVIRPVAPSPPIEQLFAPDRLWTIVARPQYPGGGWPGRARSWRSDLPS